MMILMETASRSTDVRSVSDGPRASTALRGSDSKLPYPLAGQQRPPPLRQLPQAAAVVAEDQGGSGGGIPAGGGAPPRMLARLTSRKEASRRLPAEPSYRFRKPPVMRPTLERPPAPRFPVRLPPLSTSSAAAARPSLGFGPRCAATAKPKRPSLEFVPEFGPRCAAAPAKGRTLWHVSCFRNDQDGPTTSDEGDGFKYVAQSQSSDGAEVIEEEESSSNEEQEQEQEQNFKDGDWFLQLHEIKEKLLGRMVGFQTERWTVPWTGQTIAQVMILWIATFWLVGSWIVPFLAHAAGFSKETLTHRGQALYSLLTDITEGLAGIAILHQCLGRFQPLPPGWFEFNLKGKWHLDVAFGCLLFPLVNLLSHINISLVPMSPGPVVGISSVEQSIVARDPVAMALYAVVVVVCAPLWEEIVFRGFLLPSLTRYMPLPLSILASAAAFALAHFNAQRVMPLVFLGVVMGGVFARSRNLLASMVLHSLWNGFVFLDLMK